MTAALSGGTKRNAAETRRRILDAAEAEFAAKGFDGARLATIARAAGVQQALIHHYFSDKARLYGAVIDYALDGIGAEGLDILARMPPDDVPSLVAALVDLLFRFFEDHGSVFAILRHDADSTEAVAHKLRPVFEAVVGRVDDLRARKIVRDDVDARHLCISGLAMASITAQEEHLLRALWPDARLHSPAFGAARKKEIVKTLLARML